MLVACHSPLVTEEGWRHTNQRADAGSLPQAGLKIDRVCPPTFPLVPVLRRLLPTVYCLPTFPLVTCHSSLVTGFRREEAADLQSRPALA